MTADVVAFLRAALDEIERVARAAIADQCANDEWTVDSDEDSDGQFRRATVFTTGSYSTVADMADPDGNEPTARHIALHDPRAVLARAEAERALLDVHIRDGQTCIRCEMIEPELHPCETLRWLAYGHRHTVPGYKPSWAPEGVSADA